MAAGKLKIDIRRRQILELLGRSGQVTVCELSAALGATGVTIRSDLDALAASGQLQRVPGGAVLRPKRTEAPSAQIQCLAEKQAIARAVLAHIADGSTLFINSGSTTFCAAQALEVRKRLNVVTNDLDTARLLAGRPDVRLVLLGGEVNADYGFTFGGDAMEQLQRYQPDWSILSVDGVDAAHGVTTYHAEEAIINRMMLERAHRAIIAADHRKLGRAGFTRICPLDSRFVVITDAGCPPEILAQLRETGAEVEAAEI